MILSEMEELDLQHAAAADPSEARRAVDAEPSLEEVGAAIILRNLLLILSVALLAVAAVVTIRAAQPRTYTASGSFVSQARSQSSNLAGLASQIGLRVPASDSRESPDFYADLLRTREILKAVIQEPYHPAGEAGPAVTLAEIFKVKAENEREREFATIRALRGRLSTGVNARTGVVSFAVNAPSPLVAYDISIRLMEEVNRFNLERRKSQAGAEREFTEARLREAGASLRAAEDRLQQFLERNPAHQNSPQLLFTRDRLEREVLLRQQVYTMLAESFEQARIEEIRETPLVTMVERPEIPARPDSRGILKISLLAFVGGLLVGIIVSLTREYFGRLRPRNTRGAARAALPRGAPGPA